MGKNDRPLVLGSTSPYRRELLGRLGLPFEVAAPGVDEAALPGERPAQTALRLAEAKARAVAARYGDALVIGSDQVADCDGAPVGKPGDRQRAIAQLRRLSGRTVVFHTGVALVDARSGRCRSDLVDVASTFRVLATLLEPTYGEVAIAGLDILERPITEGSHSLEQLQTGDLRAEISAAALDQLMCAKAAAVFLWTAVFARSTWKYRERAYRYVYLDAGHMAAQLSLAAVAQGLGSCPIAAFYDGEVNEILGVDGESEGIVYMTAVGRPSRPFGSKEDVRHTGRPKE